MLITFNFASFSNSLSPILFRRFVSMSEAELNSFSTGALEGGHVL